MCYFYSMPRDLTKDDGIFFCPDLKKYRDIIISTWSDIKVLKAYNICQTK